MRLCSAHPSATVPRGLPRPLARTNLRGQTHCWHPELTFFLAAYLFYVGARWVLAGHVAPARTHAHAIVSLERSLRIAIEGSVQRRLGSGVAGWVLSNVYLAGQLVVLPAALIWLYRRSRPVYRQLRSTVIATWLMAVPVFALFPVAPPRLARIGLKDTVSHQAGVALTGHSTLFYNPYAAMPSLHAGFAFGIGIAAAASVRAWWARALALLWGPLVTVSVIATGNHFVIDVVAGVGVTAVGFTASRIIAQLYGRDSGPRRLGTLVAASGADS